MWATKVVDGCWVEWKWFYRFLLTTCPPNVLFNSVYSVTEHTHTHIFPLHTHEIVHLNSVLLFFFIIFNLKVFCVFQKGGWVVGGTTFFFLVVFCCWWYVKRDSVFFIFYFCCFWFFAKVIKGRWFYAFLLHFYLRTHTNIVIKKNRKVCGPNNEISFFYYYYFLYFLAFHSLVCCALFIVTVSNCMYYFMRSHRLQWKRKTEPNARIIKNGEPKELKLPTPRVAPLLNIKN